MKKLLIVLSAAVLIVACKEADKKTTTDPALDAANAASAAANSGTTSTGVDTINFTSIEWIDKTEQTLPKIKEGEIVEITYRFKNTGTKPLVINDVTATCGCTVPEKPKEPILPGNEGLIKAKFDSNGKPGANTKTLTVLANTNGQKILQFSVDVEKK
jgi:hypothetical protein